MKAAANRSRCAPPTSSPAACSSTFRTTFPKARCFKLEFRLSRSCHSVKTRAEVRYCLPGVGIGVEFVDISPEDEQAITDEIEALMGHH
jgi:hypothetical protein